MAEVLATLAASFLPTGIACAAVWFVLKVCQGESGMKHGMILLLGLIMAAGAGCNH